jgi:hypothetical protein
VQQTAARAPRCSAALTVALAATVLSGCAATDGLMSSVALPAARTSSPASSPDDPAVTPLPAPPGPDGDLASKLVVTAQQRAYLDALVVSGVHPSSDLLALSIGSYVCQARAAKQSPQAVWDFVYPLVNSDVHNSHQDAHEGGRVSSAAPRPTDVDAATRSYIRVATERLC